MSFTSDEHIRDELRAMGKQRILLVDDEPDILEFIDTTSSKKGMTFTRPATDATAWPWPKSSFPT